MFIIYRKNKQVASVEVTKNYAVVRANTKQIFRMLTQLLPQPHIVFGKKGKPINVKSNLSVVADILKTRIFKPYRVEEAQEKDSFTAEIKDIQRVKLYYDF